MKKQKDHKQSMKRDLDQFTTTKEYKISIKS